MGGTKFFRGVSGGVSGGILSGIIAPRPAGPYPDISLAGKNPMSVALTERLHKSKDNYLLGKKQIVKMWPKLVYELYSNRVCYREIFTLLANFAQ